MERTGGELGGKRWSHIGSQAITVLERGGEVVGAAWSHVAPSNSHVVRYATLLTPPYMTMRSRTGSSAIA